MSEKFWKTFWIATIIGITLVLLTVPACNMHNDYCIRMAIKDGADPIEARIAFSQNTTTAQVISALHARPKDNIEE